jgi:hypothetical protein
MARLRNEMLLQRVAAAVPKDFLRRFGLEHPDIVEMLPTNVPPPEPPRRRRQDNPLAQMFAHAVPSDILRHLGLDLPEIVGVLPVGDLPPLEVKTDNALLFRLAGGLLLHVEFKLAPEADTLRDAMRYNLAAAMHYEQPVQTVVLCGPAITSAPDRLEAGSFTLQVTNVLLGQEDGSLALQRLRHKARRREPFTGADRVDVLLLPLLRHTRPLQALLPDIVEVGLALPDEERALTIGGLAALTMRYVDAEFAHSVLEALHMANMLDTVIDEGIRRGHALGKAEGLAEGKRAALRTVLYVRFGILPAALEERITQADPEALDALLIRAARATHLEML